jgi:hypothetical protein
VDRKILLDFNVRNVYYTNGEDESNRNIKEAVMDYIIGWFMQVVLPLLLTILAWLGIGGIFPV